MDTKIELYDEVRKEYRAAWVKEVDRIKAMHKKELLAVIDSFEKVIIQVAEDKNWKVALIKKASNLRKKYA